MISPQGLRSNNRPGGKLMLKTNDSAQNSKASRSDRHARAAKEREASIVENKEPEIDPNQLAVILKKEKEGIFFLIKVAEQADNYDDFFYYLN